MTKIVPISSKTMVKILVNLGFHLARSKGSHRFFFNAATNKTTLIPTHGNDSLGIGLIRKILRDIELSTEEYDRLRRET